MAFCCGLSRLVAMCVSGMAAPNTTLSSKLIDHRLTAKGFDRCQQFSWDKTAEQTVAVYRSLL
jgi:hypothetical protein